eukprot:NODE_666_length_4904_cov_0.563580.p4 type:complete len:106 gc:universal NODE_666_length_4904_cov_0.563580:4299-3982(-)
MINSLYLAKSNLASSAIFSSSCLYLSTLKALVILRFAPLLSESLLLLLLLLLLLPLLLNFFLIPLKVFLPCCSNSSILVLYLMAFANGFNTLNASSSRSKNCNAL